MRSTSGGVDQCTGGSAQASHNNNTAYKAFNNNGGDYWISGVSGVDQWIQYDFGAGNEVNIKEIALKPREWYYAPKNFSLQYSFDGVEYFEVAEWLNITEGWSPWEWAEFKVPGPVAKADWTLSYDLSLSTGWSLAQHTRASNRSCNTALTNSRYRIRKHQLPPSNTTMYAVRIISTKPFLTEKNHYAESSNSRKTPGSTSERYDRRHA